MVLRNCTCGKVNISFSHLLPWFSIFIHFLLKVPLWKWIYKFIHVTRVGPWLCFSVCGWTQVIFMSIGLNLEHFSCIVTLLEHWTQKGCNKASFPGLPPFLLFSLCIHRSLKGGEKTGKAWQHLSREWRLVVARWPLPNYKFVSNEP